MPHARHVDPERRPPAGRRLQALELQGLALVALSVWVPGCDAPSPLEVRPPEGATLEGRTVVWSGTEAALGAVRFGTAPGVYDAVAYPDAAGRGDRTPVLEHRVPLLGAAPGDTVWAQPIETRADGAVVAGAEVRFVMPATAMPPVLTWTMIDVGFGDAHLIETPSGIRVMIDAGERRDEQNVERWLDATGIGGLDVAVATHIHEDHIGGFVGSAATDADGVLAGYPVGRFLDAPSHSGTRWAWTELVRMLDARAVPLSVVAAGDDQTTNAALAWDPAVRVKVLHAGDGRAAGGETENDWINDDSIVMRVSFGEVDLMLGGDAEATVQWALLSAGAVSECEVLKVHHHGASDATDPAYLAAVNPRVALIPITVYETWNASLPSPIVLDRLRARRVDVFASDRAMPLDVVLSGDRGLNVSVITDGASYTVRATPSASVHVPGTQAAAEDLP